MAERQYTAADFDENGEFIRDPRYMVSEELASRNLVGDEEEEKQPEVFHLQHNGKSYQVKATSRDEAIDKVLQAAGGAKDTAKAEVDPIEEQRQNNQQRIQQVSDAMNTLATNPIGSAVPDPLERRPSPLGIGRIRPPSPDEDWVLHNQARDRGIDIDSGATMDVRLGQGLASLKDPQLRYNMLETHYRKKLYEAGVEWPENVPVVMLEQQTGKLAYVRPIGEDDINRGDSPENVGKTRLTLVNPEGFDVGDMAEFLPAFTIGALEVGGSLAAGAVGSTVGSPQAAIFASAGITAGIEALATPVKNKLLKEYYGVSDEELAKFSDPDEALNQALLGGGLDLAMGQAWVFGRWMKNRSGKRTLTEDDYTALVDELDEVRKIEADFKLATGEAIEDPLMFVEAASKKMDTTTGQSIGVKSVNFFKRLPEKIKRVMSTANDVTRLKLARGFRYIANKATAETENLSRVGLDENGLVMTRDAITDNADDILYLTRQEYGVNAAQRNVAETTDEAARAMDEIHDAVATANYKDINTITTNDVAIAKANEELQWAYWKDMLEPNATGSQFNIGISNGPNSPIRRTLGSLNREAADNYSKTLGDRTAGFVNDLEALKGETLDIMGLQRLRSDMLRAKRKVSNGTDTSGWTENEISELIDSIDATMIKNDWVRISTGKKVPAVQRQGLDQWHKARESTDFMNNIARNSTVQDLVDSVQVFDSAVGRRVGERRRFTMQPAQVRDTLFEAGNSGALLDVMNISGHHPGLRAALANELEAVYKGMALNADGTFARGGYNKFMQQYGDHAEILFGPERAAKLTHADSMARAVEDVNLTAKKVEDAYKNAFGDAVDPQKVGANGVANTIMSSSNVTARQARTLMNRLKQIDPSLHAATRAEFSQWMYGQLAKNPVQLKNGNAIRTLLEGSKDKISAVMGPQFVADLKAVQRATDLVDLSDLARGVAEPVSPAWLQVTRSVFGPLSRKQRFMTAANRIMRGRGAAKAISLMSDPDKLRGFVQLGKLNPNSAAFWSTANALGLRFILGENGIHPPADLETMQVREEALRRLAQGGPL
jgi:hypothetical protein